MSESKNTTNVFDQELEKESRRHRRWKWLSWLGRLFKVGTVIRSDTGNWPDLAEKAPLVELAKIAKYGLKDEPRKGRLEIDDLRRIMIVCNAVAKSDGDISAEEQSLTLALIEETGPEGITERDRENLMTIFKTGSVNYQQLRNDIFLLKREVHQKQLQRIVEILYRLAYTGGLETRESHQVADIAKGFGLALNEIRLAQMSAKKTAN